MGCSHSPFEVDSAQSDGHHSNIEEADQPTPWPAPVLWVSSGQVFEDLSTHDAPTWIYPRFAFFSRQALSSPPTLKMMMQGSLQHLPAITDDPMSYGYSNWDRLIASRDNGVQSKEHLNRSRAEMNGMPTPSHFEDPVNLNDPLFFHPQHPRSAENFDLGEFDFGHQAMGTLAEKSPAIPQKLYPTYQLPGLSYGVRHDGGVLISARYNYPVPNKRNIDAAQQEVAAVGVPNKKRRLTGPAN